MNTDSSAISNLSIDYIQDYEISPISEGIISCVTTGNVLTRLQYGSDGDQRRGDGMVSTMEFPFTAEFTCRLCEEGIVDYVVEKASISIDTDSFYE